MYVYVNRRWHQHMRVHAYTGPRRPAGQGGGRFSGEHPCAALGGTPAPLCSVASCLCRAGREGARGATCNAPARHTPCRECICALKLVCAVCGPLLEVEVTVTKKKRNNNNNYNSNSNSNSSYIYKNGIFIFTSL